MTTLNRPPATPPDASLTEVRALLGRLRALADVDAPASLLSSVLGELGLDAADRYFPLRTPVGQIFVAFNDRGLSAVMRGESAADFEQAARALLGRPVHPAAEPPARLVAALERSLRGEGKPALRFDLRGLSEFEQAVLLKALEIPRGEVRPYAWIAREIGRPRAVRAVGTALAHNPIPIFIPCHRVVLSDGTLGRYSMGGDAIKRAILAAEGAAPDVLEELARSGIRYYGSDTTRIFCFPTCGHAHRISPAHMRYFASEAEARAAGYRPCKVCRPALGA
jgi:O-6-methylguanine DNA methyltransferase